MATATEQLATATSTSGVPVEWKVTFNVGRKSAPVAQAEPAAPLPSLRTLNRQFRQRKAELMAQARENTKKLIGREVV